MVRSLESSCWFRWRLSCWSEAKTDIWHPGSAPASCPGRDQQRDPGLLHTLTALSSGAGWQQLHTPLPFLHPHFQAPPADIGAQWDDLQPPAAGSVPTVMGELPEAATASRRHGSTPWTEMQTQTLPQQPPGQKPGCHLQWRQWTSWSLTWHCWHFCHSSQIHHQASSKREPHQKIKATFGSLEDTATQLPMEYQADRRN